MTDDWKWKKIHGALGCALMAFAFYNMGWFWFSTITAIIGAIYSWLDHEDTDFISEISIKGSLGTKDNHEVS